MPSISSRGESAHSSPSRKLAAAAEQAKQAGKKVYLLNIGQPDIATPEKILEAVRQSDFKVLEYSHSAGMESYRKKLAEYYHHVGIEVARRTGGDGFGDDSRGTHAAGVVIGGKVADQHAKRRRRPESVCGGFEDRGLA